MDQDDQAKNIQTLRERADQVRLIATSIRDRQCRSVLVRLADSYESMVAAAKKAHVAGKGLKF